MAGVKYVDVESIDEYLEKVQAAGGSVVQPRIPIPGHDTSTSARIQRATRWGSSPGVGYIATCQDTEGNPPGFFQTDENASY